MKERIIIGITVIACVALCAALWPRGTEVEDLPAELSIPAVTAETEARSEEMPPVISSADSPAPKAEAIAVSEPVKAEITPEEKTKKPASPLATQPVKPSPSLSEPHMGDVRIVDGEKQVYILGFGWIKDEGGGNAGTVAKDMYENGNKIGVMGGGTTVGNPGDDLTGNKVGIMGGDTTVHGKGDINKQVGVMGGEEPPKESAPSSSAQPEPSGEVIYIELQPPVTKDSTPPPYKPNGEPTNP